MNFFLKLRTFAFSTMRKILNFLEKNIVQVFLFTCNVAVQIREPNNRWSNTFAHSLCAQRSARRSYLYFEANNANNLEFQASRISRVSWRRRTFLSKCKILEGHGLRIDYCLWKPMPREIVDDITYPMSAILAMSGVAWGRCYARTGVCKTSPFSESCEGHDL